MPIHKHSKGVWGPSVFQLNPYLFFTRTLHTKVNKLDMFEQSIQDSVNACKEESILFRLQIGHTYVTHGFILRLQIGHTYVTHGFILRLQIGHTYVTHGFILGNEGQWLLAYHCCHPPSTLRLSNIGLGLYLDG